MHPLLIIGGRVYKEKYLTILEIVSYINVTCLSILSILFTDTYHDTHVVSTDVIVSVSVSIEILLFFIIITVHCYLSITKMFPKFKLHFKTRVPSEDELPLIAGDTEEGSPSSREELIFDLYLMSIIIIFTYIAT